MKPANCECTHSFTCRACLDRCVERNIADRNNAPLESPHKPTQEFCDKFNQSWKENVTDRLKRAGLIGEIGEAAKRKWTGE